MDAPPPVLEKRTIFTGDGVTIGDVRCRSCRSSWSPPEQAERYALVFVRRGCFRRRTDESEVVADVAAVYLERPGESYEIAHPHEGGDACTEIALDDALVSATAADEPRLRRPLTFTPPHVDLEHRLLVADARRGNDVELGERTISLAASLLSVRGEGGTHGRRRSAAAARRRAVDGAREAVAASPRIGLVELARSVAVSPHHLSRIFRAETGETISRYRNRVRVRLALERLADGEECLTRLAAELGFADHAHLTRNVRTELGSTPSALRRLVRTGSPGR